MVLLPFAVFAFCIILIAFLALKIMLISFVATVIVVCVIALLWKTTDKRQKKRKKETLLWGAIGVQVIVLMFAIEHSKNKLFPDMGPYREKKAEIQAIFENREIENKFERSFALAASAEATWERRDLRNYAIETFIRAKPDNYFSEADLAVAQMEFEKEQKKQGNLELNPCRAENSSFYAQIVAHRDGPGSLVTLLERYYQDRPYCQSAIGSLSYLVLERCKGVWLSRCKSELNLEKLAPFLEEPTPEVVANDLRQFIREASKL